MHTRRCLIEIDSLTSKTKAFLLMILDLYYSNFNHTTLENCIEKLYNKYLNDSHSEKVQRKKEAATERERVTVKKQENGRIHATTSRKAPVKIERRSESVSYSRSVPPKSPTKKSSSPTRKSEPHYYYRSQSSQPPQRTPQKNTSQPQRKISPKELQNRARTSPHQPASSMSPKALFKVEKELDKLNIEAAQHQSPKHVQANGDENILRQQNSSENSSPINTLKPKPPATNNSNSKVYFREENSENLSWNGENSFEDDPDGVAESPRVNQYSNSFLNFLSNN